MLITTLYTVLLIIKGFNHTSEICRPVCMLLRHALRSEWPFIIIIYALGNPIYMYILYIIIIKRRSGINPIPPMVIDQD